MKSFLLSALLLASSLTGCAAATAPDEPEVESAPAAEENVASASSELKGKGIDHGKYCLPGEVVHCSLFPVVCTCVPAPVVAAPFGTVFRAAP